jgi:hypothetical protein
MKNVEKKPKGVADVPHLSGAINPSKIAMNDAPNLGSFDGVRTTATSEKEGRLKVDAGATPKVKVKKLIIKKVLNKFK